MADSNFLSPDQSKQAWLRSTQMDTDKLRSTCYTDQQAYNLSVLTS